MLASEHWKHKFPKFKTPEKKAELEQFAKKISDECSLPEAHFFTDGIAQRIRDFFSEQRRFHKNKQKVSGLLLTHVYQPVHISFCFTWNSLVDFCEFCGW